MLYRVGWRLMGGGTFCSVSIIFKCKSTTAAKKWGPSALIPSCSLPHLSLNSIQLSVYPSGCSIPSQSDHILVPFFHRKGSFGSKFGVKNDVTEEFVSNGITMRATECSGRNGHMGLKPARLDFMTMPITNTCFEMFGYTHWKGLLMTSNHFEFK